ncbi:phenoloxidase-activating factor 1 [Aedes albopictus]|uniref:Peptidase S1 domain-containing protein n=1 Tax=Aedes albopictus TaxID=7160 RepID=A0ABM1YUE2_AEDAL|nr:phenoloxidase-activating factor 1-like [Aedes albopictus]
MGTKVIVSQLLLLMWYQLSQAATMVPASPCSDKFSYKFYPGSKQIIGYIQLSGLNADVTNTLEVKVYEGASRSGQKTYLNTYKSLDSTYNDIKNYGTAKFWLNFALQCPIPVLVSMSINGKLICSGTPRQAVRTMTHSIIPPKKTAAPTVGRIFSAPAQTTAKPIVTSSAPVEKQDICGTFSLLTDLSFNGTPSRVGQFPWAVPLFHHNATSGLKYFCGGTIVTDRHILTAAHCTINMRPQEILAIPGKHNISNTFAINGAVHANVQQIVSHEDYDSDSEHLVDQDADIAVLRLEQSLTFTNLIRPICLWRDQNSPSVNRNQKGLVSGWGLTENGYANTSSYYTSTIVSKQQCSDNMGVSIPNRARLFCGDGSGSVACEGDSGSAMAVKHDNRFYLRGLVSKAAWDPLIGKCDTTKYVMYTDVSKFIGWILQKIDNDDGDDGDDYNYDYDDE